MFLDTGYKFECFGCETCEEVCPKKAITMKEDVEGFRYPFINNSLCIHCNLCRKACPYEEMPKKHRGYKYTYGGYCKDPDIRFESTSGGAFSAIVEAFCDNDYVIFGAKAKGLQVFHCYTTEKDKLWMYRKSKYLQSIIGGSYEKVKCFLSEGQKVLFSGTPCQVAGLYAYLNAENFKEIDNLLTIEVICEGVPSPLYIRKLDDMMKKRYGSRIENLDYRFTGKSFFSHGKWDFEIMRIQLENKKVLKKDRWVNPFWSIWLNHLMSRPSCYECPFSEQGRVADITLGDLWGVHLYCQELYGNNGGSSLAIGNTKKGIKILKSAEKYMYGHELVYEEALKYQSPLRKKIEINPLRPLFMADLESSLSYSEINRKWAKKPSLKLICQKYIWGNRQKIAIWIIKKRISNGVNNHA